ncbi:MAG: major capsid protein P2 [Opitutaceae bacterium]|nr:major capsid protein P2 [Opitutaceae bacterium]
MRIYEPVSGIEGVASGASASIKIPVNRRLHLLRLFAAAAGPIYGTAVIDTVFIYVGSKLIRQVTAQELVDIATLNGFTVVQATDGIPIFFSEPWRASVMDEQVTAWDLWGQNDMTLKVQLKTGLTTPTLAAVMDHDDGFTTNAQNQRVLNIVKHSPNYQSGGTVNDIMTLDIAYPIHRIYLYPPVGTTISKVKAILNNVQTIHEMTPAQNAAFLKDYKLVAPTPAAGAMYPLIFDVEQQFFTALNPPQALRVTVESDLGGQIKALIENHAPAYI